jgi:hypothetical protein
VQSRQSTQIQSKFKEAELKMYQKQRTDFLNKELAQQLKRFGMGVLFGWDDQALQVDIALGVNRKECLIEALEKTLEHFKTQYKDVKHGTQKTSS